MSADDNFIARAGVHEQERLRQAIDVAEQERVNEVAKSVRLESECVAALNRVDRMRLEGSQAVTTARGEAARSAIVAEILRPSKRQDERSKQPTQRPTADIRTVSQWALRN